jgi:hypothetical protein
MHRAQTDFTFTEQRADYYTHSIEMSSGGSAERSVASPQQDGVDNRYLKHLILAGDTQTDRPAASLLPLAPYPLQ